MQPSFLANPSPSAMGTPSVADIRRLIAETDDKIKEKELALRGLHLRSQSSPVCIVQSPLASLIEKITAENHARTRASHEALPALPRNCVPPVPAPSAERLGAVAAVLGKRRNRLVSRYRHAFNRQLIDRAIWKSHLPQPERDDGAGAQEPERCSHKLVEEVACLPGQVLPPNDERSIDLFRECGDIITRPIAPRRVQINLAAVPTWDPIVASQQCAVVPCGVRQDDPLESWYASRLINPWTVHERFWFLKLFRKVGNDFQLIAEGLTYKCVREVVSFYYQNRFFLGLEKLRKGRRGRPRVVSDDELFSLAQMGHPAVDMRSCK